MKSLDAIAQSIASQAKNMDSLGRKRLADDQFVSFLKKDEKRKDWWNGLGQDERVRMYDSYLGIVNEKSGGALSGVYDLATENLYESIQAGTVKVEDLPDDMALAMYPVLKQRGSAMTIAFRDEFEKRIKDNVGSDTDSLAFKLSSMIGAAFGRGAFEVERKQDYAPTAAQEEGLVEYDPIKNATEAQQRRQTNIREMTSYLQTGDITSIDNIQTAGNIAGLMGGSAAAYRQLQRYGFASVFKVATNPREVMKTLGAQGAVEVAISAPFAEGETVGEQAVDTFQMAALGLVLGVGADKALDIIKETKAFPRMAAMWGNAIDRFSIDGLRKIAQPMSARIEKFSPHVANEMRRYLMKSRMRAQVGQDVAGDFLNMARSVLKKNEYADLGYHLARGDREAANKILYSHGDDIGEGLSKKLSKVDEVNAEFLTAARESGIEVGEIPDYWARRIQDKKYKQYLKDKGINESEKDLAKLFRDAELEYGRPLTDADKAAILDNHIVNGRMKRGVASSNTKERVVMELDRADYDKYYDSFDKSMLKYYDNMALAIEKRNFFGMGVNKPVRNGKPIKYEVFDSNGSLIDVRSYPAPRKPIRLDESGLFVEGQRVLDLEQTIGGYMQNLLDQGKIQAKHFNELVDLSRTVFGGAGGTTALSRSLSNLTYGAMLGQFDTAALQMTDIAIEASKTGKSAFRGLLGKNFGKDVGLQSIGLEGLQFDIIDRSLRDGAVAHTIDRMFKLTGLRHIDATMKGMSAKAGLDQFLHLRGKNLDHPEMQKFIANQAKYFGDDAVKLAEDISGLPSKISNAHLTEDMRLLMFSNLSRHQPVSILEYPEAYIKNGNLRFLYSLKSFMLKYIDNMNRMTLREWTAGNKKQAVKNAVVLGSLMGSSQYGFEVGREYVYDQVSSIVRDGKPSGKFERDLGTVHREAAFDGLWNAVGFNKYIIDKSISDFPRSLVDVPVNFLLGPSPKIATDILESAAKGVQDVTGYRDWGIEDYRAIKYLPMVGRPIDRSVGPYRRFIESQTSDPTILPRVKLPTIDTGLK